MAFISSVGLTKSSFQGHQLVSRRLSVGQVNCARGRRAVVMSATVVEKGAGMKLIKSADEATISQLGCRSWSKWGCEPSKFPWTYSDDEVSLVLEGEFTVIPDDGGESMDVEAGDIAYFPKGMSCTWDVRKTVRKQFVFGMKL